MQLVISCYTIFLILYHGISRAKISYNVQKENWDIYELIANRVQEEGTMSPNNNESIDLTLSPQNKKRNDNHKNIKPYIRNKRVRFRNQSNFSNGKNCLCVHCKDDHTL